MEIITKSSKETADFGAKIAHSILVGKNNKDGASIVALVGDLGAGKTTFVQGFIKELGIKNRVVSPTFVIMREYSVPPKKHNNYSYLYHIDVYRIENKIARELENIGVSSLLKDPSAIILVEWADKVKEYFPTNTLWVTINHLSSDSRKIVVNTNESKN